MAVPAEAQGRESAAADADGATTGPQAQVPPQVPAGPGAEPAETVGDGAAREGVPAGSGGGADDSGFRPANEVERDLLRVVADGDPDAFLKVLATAEVLLPIPQDMDYSLKPGRAGFPWQTGEIDGVTVVPLFTSPERMRDLIGDAAAASGQGPEYIALPFVAVARYWPDHRWGLAVNNGTPVGATLPGERLRGLSEWADQIAAQRMVDGFEPQNDIERRLFEAAMRRDGDTFFTVLAGAQVLVPADPETPWGIRPDDPEFPWRPVPVRGAVSIQVFTSLKWMHESIGPSRFVMPAVLEILTGWPDAAWTLVVNPGTPISAVMPSDRVRALAEATRPTAPGEPGERPPSGPAAAAPGSVAAGSSSDEQNADWTPARPEAARREAPGRREHREPVSPEPAREASPEPEPEPQFEPGNRIDQELYEAALVGDTDAFLRVLLAANVLVPISADAPLEVTPVQPEFGWEAAMRDASSVQVFTSLVRLREALPASRFVYCDFRELIGSWPRADWAMVLNPGTRIGASLMGDQVQALSEWAVRVGLIQPRPPAPAVPPGAERRPFPPGPARPAAGPAHPADDPEQTVTDLPPITDASPRPPSGPAKPPARPARTTADPTRTTTDPRAMGDPAQTTTDPARVTPGPARSTADPSRPPADPTHGMGDPTRTAVDPALSMTDPARTMDDPTRATAGPAQATTGPTGAAADPTRTTTDPSRTAADPLRTVTDPAHAPADPAYVMGDPAGATTGPLRAAADPAHAPDGPARPGADPTRTTIDPTRTTADPMHAPDGPTQHGADPTRTTTDPTQAMGDPAGATTGPLRAAADPAHAPDGPARPGADPTRTTIDPTRTAVDPTQAMGDPTETTADLSGATTGPLRAAADPTQTTTGPTRVPTDPAHAPGGPAQPGADPARTAADPVQAMGDPAQTVVDPAQVPADPLRTVADPVQAAGDPARTAVDGPVRGTGDPNATIDDLGQLVAGHSSSSPRDLEPLDEDELVPPDVLQKVLPHGHVGWYLEQGYDRVGGFVHPVSDVTDLQTPVQLYEALGLLYDDSPFSPGDEGVYVIRWPAYCQGLYRIPFGGQSEQELLAWGEAGWVQERPPFTGDGFAAGSAGSIREYKVDSARLPYGAEMYHLGRDRSERFIAMYDPDRLAWVRPGDDGEGAGRDDRAEAAQ